MKKIECFVDSSRKDFNHRGTIAVYNRKHALRPPQEIIDPDVPAVLLISEDGEAPKVMTLEEVKAMFVEIIEHPIVSYAVDGTMHKHEVRSASISHIKRIASVHNITLP